MKLPKTFETHPAIKFADLGENQSSDYKFYIELKSGWEFTWGKYEGCSSGFFNRVRDFTMMEPLEVLRSHHESKDSGWTTMEHSTPSA